MEFNSGFKGLSHHLSTNSGRLPAGTAAEAETFLCEFSCPFTWIL